MEINIENAKKILKKYLKEQDEEKYKHSLRVATVSKILAEKWNVPPEDCIISGLLHDIGKGISKQEILNLCFQNNITMYDFEIFETPKALHGRISSFLFEKEFDKTDIERFNSISHAISYHVAGGDEKMSDLDKILYIADNIEPKKNSRLYKEMLSQEKPEMDEWMKKIINIKRKKANQMNRVYNPLIDATLDALEDER